MKVLPPVTKPATAPIARRHEPRAANAYRAYRPCLRWEFGFTCPFCLLHEADFVRGGWAEGSGLTSVEHISPQSVAPIRKNEYENCVYCCRYCNRARSAWSIQGNVGRLLDPTKDAWATHFEAEGDRLLPVSGDGNALYTHDTYDLDDARKVRLRRCRRILIMDHCQFVENGFAPVAKLVELAEQNQNSPEIVESLLSCADRIRRSIFHAIEDLKGYRAVPPDADLECRCTTAEHRTLPAYLETQTRELPFGD